MLVSLDTELASEPRVEYATFGQLYRGATAGRRRPRRDVAKDWPAVAAAIRDRLTELEMTQTDLAARSAVSYATVRDLLRNPDARQRNPRTLAALSEALGWHSGHLAAILAGHDPGDPDARDPVLAELDRIHDTLKSLDQRLDAIERQLAADGEAP